MFLSNYVTCDFIRDATSFENMQQRSLYRFKLIFPARLCYGISFYFICDFLKSKKEPDSRLGLGTNRDNCPSACRHLFSFLFFFPSFSKYGGYFYIKGCVIKEADHGIKWIYFPYCINLVIFQTRGLKPREEEEELDFWDLKRKERGKRSKQIRSSKLPDHRLGLNISPFK